MASIKIYNPNEFVAIINACFVPAEIDDLKNYLLENAPDFIREYGESNYNSMVNLLKQARVKIFRARNNK